MKRIALPLIIATACMFAKTLAFADNESFSSDSVMQRIKSSNSSSPAAQWPRSTDTSDDLLKQPLEKRLNQLVLDDNLRTLHMSVHSDFARNTQSFKRIETLVSKVANRNLSAKERWQAAQALGDERHVYSVYALPVLIQSYNADPDITVRTYAALSLVKIDLRSSVPQLIYGLDNSDADIRQVSASALHQAGERAVPILVKLVKCDDPYLKHLGCLALAEVGASAKNSLAALRGAATELDAPGVFSETATNSIDKIRKESQALELASKEMSFDSAKWQGAENEVYRPSMVRYILSRNLLNGMKSAEVLQLLGRGISADGGRQLRYSIGTLPEGFFLNDKKKHAHSTSEASRLEPKDSWLVVSLNKDIVSDCRVQTSEQLEGSLLSAEASNSRLPSGLLSASAAGDLLASH
jgi:hypothetical protein